MLLFNPTALAYHLRDGTLTEQEKFGYIVATIIIRLLNDAPAHIYASNQTLGSVILWLILFSSVFFFGLRVCFRTNSRGDNKNFIERWLCLSVPLQIWTSLVPNYISLTCYRLYAHSTWFNLFDWFSSIVNWLLFILYFILLNRFIAIVAGLNSSDSQSDSAPIAAP